MSNSQEHPDSPVALPAGSPSLGFESATFSEVTLVTPGTKFSVDIAVCKGMDGYTAYAVHLPGTVSDGDTVDEAIANIQEALEVSLAEYVSTGEIPWTNEAVPMDGEVVLRKKVLVNV
jgi:predicted RNase H-like HicB family nuclease